MSASRAMAAFLVLLVLAQAPSACLGGRASQSLGVSIYTPRQGDVVSGVVNISGGTFGSDLPNTTVSISIDGGPWFGARGVNPWTKGWDTVGVDNGPHTIHAMAADSYGVAYGVDITVTVDNPPPVTPRIINASPAATDMTTRQGVNLTFEVTVVGETPMCGIIWLLNGSRETGPSASNHSWEFWTPGNYTVEARFLRGDVVLDTRIWNITILPPNRGPLFSKSSIAPGNYTASKGEAAEFNIVAKDPDSAELFYYWFYDDEQLNVTGPNVTIKFDKGGNHRLRVVISDGETNISVRWNFEVEDLAPASFMDYAPCMIYIIVGLVLGVAYGRKARARSRPA